MIKPMNKYAFLIYHREYEEFLKLLQTLGVVHITRKRKPQEEDSLKAILDERLTLRQTEKSLKAWVPDGSEAVAVEEIHEDVITRATDLLERWHKLSEELQQKQDKAKAQSIWGEYDPDEVEALKLRGYSLVGYSMPGSLYTEDYIQTYSTVTLAKEGVLQYFVRLEEDGEQPCPDAERHEIPLVRLSTLEEEVREANLSLSSFENELQLQAPRVIAELQSYDSYLEDKFAFGAALLQGETQANDRLVFIEGWIPTEDAPAMEQALHASGYYFQKIEIEEQDNVPISLKNNAFSRGFELITKMFSLPNYHEIDQTALFAPFFMLFFGLCMGDAGYGLLVFGVSTYLRLKAKKGDDTLVYQLLQWLGGGAFFIGLLMGSFFGVVLPYADHKDYFLNQDNQMILSVVVGLLQILFAKGVAAYKTKLQKGIKYAIAPFAWIIFLIGIGVTIGLPYAGISLPKVGEYILDGIVGISVLAILFYSVPGKNPLVNVGTALFKTYETASGLLGDTLSYIRLFAIGLTGAVLGGVFNSLAIEQTASLPLVARLPLMLIILLSGHSINIALAMIGALVHPIRLTFVEYYKNSEFEGGGVAYDPLRYSKTTKE